MSLQIQNRSADEERVLKVMRDILYPDADEGAVNLVLAYCEAMGLDPLLKPYHITYVNYKDEKEKWHKRPQILPSITLYRIKAHRSGNYLGHTQPEFGPDVTEILDGVTITYPQWCKMTFFKKVGKDKAKIPVFQTWKGNYATKERKSVAPNSMWLKRPYEQLAKCTEAQGLRELQPELVGSLVTIEEMEGKEFSGSDSSYSSRGERDITPHPAAIPIEKINPTTLQDLTTICCGYDEYMMRMQEYLKKKELTKISDLCEKDAQRVLAEMLKDEKAVDLLLQKEEEVK